MEKKIAWEKLHVHFSKIKLQPTRDFGSIPKKAEKFSD